MKDVFARLGADFFSTILFIAIYLATDNVLLATGVALAGAIAQVIYSRIKGKELGYMTWASLALVIVLGSATLLTHDPRFVLAKPAIGHFAIGVIMLKRGWMLRYLPPIELGGSRKPFRFAGKKCRGDKNGRGRKLEPHHEHADGRAQGYADPAEFRRYADGHAGRRWQFHRNLRWRHQRRRRQLEGLDHEPDAVDPRVHRQGFRRQHVRRNGHRPDGQLPLHRDAGLIGEEAAAPPRSHPCTRQLS